MTQVILGKSRVREICMPGSVRAKAEWLSYSTIPRRGGSKLLQWDTHAVATGELHNGDNFNLDIGRSVTCGVGRNILLFGLEEAAQKMRRSRRADQKASSRAM